MSRAFNILVPVLLFVSPCCSYLHKYVLYTDANMTTWTKAQSFCRKHHSDLAIITNTRDNELVRNLKGWIGLHRYNSTAPWKWSLTNKEPRFVKWAANEPQDEHCAIKDEGKTVWKTKQCDDKHSFLCSDESVVLVYQNKTWEEALHYCRALWKREPFAEDRNFDLSTPISQNDINKAREMAGSATTNEVWTGLRFLAGRWLWVSGEPVDVDQICPNINSCGVLDKSGDLWIRDCAERRNFLCQKIPKTTLANIVRVV